MRFLPTSYADFLTISKSLEVSPQFGYFPWAAGQGYFVYAFLPTSSYFVVFNAGGIDPANFPDFATDMPGAIQLAGTFDFQGSTGNLINIDQLTDFVTLVGLIPGGKVLFGIDANSGDLEAFSVGGTFVLHFDKPGVTAAEFLAVLPNAIQLLDQVSFSMEYE
jgi:hypothetical protein